MSQTERLKWYLVKHGRIDPLTAWVELGIYRLGARCFDLRRSGMNIASKLVPVRNKFGEVCHVAEYRYVE